MTDLKQLAYGVEFVVVVDDVAMWLRVKVEPCPPIDRNPDQTLHGDGDGAYQEIVADFGC
jgi:hypothetical protein